VLGSYHDYSKVTAIGVRTLWQLGTLQQRTQPVYISGAPRSGTTWVLETLERAVFARRYWEPIKGLQVARGPVARYAGGLRPTVLTPDENPDFQAFIARVLDNSAPLYPGQARSRKLGRAENLRRIGGAGVTLIKFTAAQRALPWMTGTFSNRGLVVLRNPLSLVASLKAMTQRPEGWAVQQVPNTIQTALCEMFPRCGLLSMDAFSQFDEVVLRACLDTILPVRSSHATEGPLAYISYEALTGDPTLFEAVIDWLGLAPFQQAPVEHTETSATTRADSNVARGGNPNLSWQHRLDVPQVDRTLAIMEELGIDFYDAERDRTADHLAERGFRVIS